MAFKEGQGDHAHPSPDLLCFLSHSLDKVEKRHVWSFASPKLRRALTPELLSAHCTASSSISRSNSYCHSGLGTLQNWTDGLQRGSQPHTKPALIAINGNLREILKRFTLLPFLSAVLPHRKVCNGAIVLWTDKFSHNLTLVEVSDEKPFTKSPRWVTCLPSVGVHAGSVSDLLQHLWHSYCPYMPADLRKSRSKLLLT